MWTITHVQVMLSLINSLIPLYGIVNSCGAINMYVVYVVLSMGMSLLPAI
jgi:ABC-type glycerol-3-phosphate transport system permease component